MNLVSLGEIKTTSKPKRSKKSLTTPRECKCGCGHSIAHKHPNALFLNQNSGGTPHSKSELDRINAEPESKP